MKIIPAILTDNAKDLELKIRQSELFAEIAQIDIMDGRFVPSSSINAEDLGKIKTSLFLEAHLMVEHPIDEVTPFKKAGVKRIIFHFESKDDPQDILRKIKEEGLEAGIAVNPGTEISQVESFLEELDILLIMAVNPGFYGSKFIPEVLQKARALFLKKRNYLIALDGGVKSDNIRDIRDAGVEIACVGSGIFGKGESRNNFFSLIKSIGVL
ncbi:MAG: ribulose-phosphate 3-epimerase [Candidatus Omnitrophica bacterium]|nr:ribulose-phosphate 3-epimerase [Candidatus Omnitrophota bacterium]